MRCSSARPRPTSPPTHRPKPPTRSGAWAVDGCRASCHPRLRHRRCRLPRPVRRRGPLRPRDVATIAAAAAATAATALPTSTTTAAAAVPSPTATPRPHPPPPPPPSPLPPPGVAAPPAGRFHWLAPEGRFSARARADVPRPAVSRRRPLRAAARADAAARAAAELGRSARPLPAGGECHQRGGHVAEGGWCCAGC